MILSIFVEYSNIRSMANLLYSNTNIKPPIKLWISPDDGYPHGPRIKVYYTGRSDFNDPNFSVLISDEPGLCDSDTDNYRNYKNSNVNKKTLNTIYDLVYFHRELLMLFWDKKIKRDNILRFIISNYKWNKEMTNIRKVIHKLPQDYQSIISKLRWDPEKYEKELDKNPDITIEELFK